MMGKKQLILFVSFGLALSGLEMATGLLSQLLSRQFYWASWAVLLLVYVIWSALIDFVKEVCHEAD